MKLSVPLILLFLATIANAATPDDFRAYAVANKPAAERGELKWSEYYQNAYNILLTVRPLPPSSYLNTVSELILHAQEFESGKISADQFAYYRRAAQTSAIAHGEQMQQEQQRNAGEAQRAEMERRKAAYEAMKINPRPVPYTVVPPPKTTTTDCYALGNTLNCTTR